MYEANLQKRWIFRMTSRSSRSEVILEILQNLQEIPVPESLFTIKLQASGLKQ